MKSILAMEDLLAEASRFLYAEISFLTSRPSYSKWAKYLLNKSAKHPTRDDIPTLAFFPRKKSGKCGCLLKCIDDWGKTGKNICLDLFTVKDRAERRATAIVYTSCDSYIFVPELFANWTSFHVEDYVYYVGELEDQAVFDEITSVNSKGNHVPCIDQEESESVKRKKVKTDSNYPQNTKNVVEVIFSLSLFLTHPFLE